MKTGIIYRAYNKITKKSYIGQTINGLKKRKHSHFYKAKKYNDCYFYRALNKYQVQDWIWTVLDQDIEEEKLNDLEVFYVSEFDSYNNGYNSTKGGSFTHSVAEPRTLFHSELGFLTKEVSEFSQEFNISKGNIYSVLSGNRLYAGNLSLKRLPTKTKKVCTRKKYILIFEGQKISGDRDTLKRLGMTEGQINYLNKGKSGYNYQHIAVIEETYINDRSWYWEEVGREKKRLRNAVNKTTEPNS